MKLTNLIAAGSLIAAIAFAPVVTVAQDKQQEKKDLAKTQDKLAKNEAQKNKAIKKGEPKKAVADEKKVQKDKKEIHKEKKEIHSDKK
jgi:uncharacterized protein HemX